MAIVSMYLPEDLYLLWKTWETKQRSRKVQDALRLAYMTKEKKDKVRK